MDSNKDLPIFIKWVEFIEWLFLKTEKFPRKVRFIFVNRIENLALDIVEDLIEARYSKNKMEILKKANLRLEKLRVLLRMSYNQKFINLNAYEYAGKSINEVGKMLGGWIKQKEVAL